MSKLFSIRVTKKNMQYIYHLEETVQGMVKNAVRWESKLLAYAIRKQYFSSRFGTYSKASELAKSILPMDAVTLSASTVMGGVEMGDGLPYAHRFIGPTGQTTTIFPTKSKALAIPLNPSADAMLRAQTSLRAFPLTARKGVLHVRNYDGSAGAPMFVLRKSVTIRSRIDPQTIAFQNTMPVMAGIRSAVFNGLRVLGG